MAAIHSRVVEVIKKPLNVILGSILLVILFLFVIGQVRHTNDWRFCQDDISFDVDFSKHRIVFDDGTFADQQWPIKACDADVRQCFVSIISFNSKFAKPNSYAVFFNTGLYFDGNGKLNRIEALNYSGSKKMFNRCNYKYFYFF